MGGISPTAEQSAIIDEAVRANDMVVDACAGSGKTSTLRMAAEAMRPTKILYLVYNRAAADDARATMPSNVEVRTTSALGLRAFYQYKDRITGKRVPARTTAKLLGIKNPFSLGELEIHPVSMASMVVDTVDRFAYTADKHLDMKHVSIPPGFDPAQEDALRRQVLAWAKKMWRETWDENSGLRLTYDYAFKLFAMGNGSIKADAIMLDEAQDSNGIVEHFVKKADAQTIIVGDPAQQLYGWRGAVNVMDRFSGPRLTLSRSWRFGKEIAEEAEKWLAHTKTGIRVSGNPSMDSQVNDGGLSSPDAVLCRSNGCAMENAIDYLEQGLSVAMAGGTKSLTDLAYAASDLRQGNPTTHPELIAFKTWSELMEFTEEPGGGDLKALVNLVNRYGVPGIIDACNRMVDETPKKWNAHQWSPPDVVVSTAHKSKGREWNSVRIGEDFKPPEDVKDPATGLMVPGTIRPDEAMLHYVAVTRARDVLDRGGLAWIDEYQAPAEVATAEAATAEV